MTTHRFLAQLLVIGMVAGVVACRQEPRPLTEDDRTMPGATEPGRDEGATRVGAMIEATDVRMALAMDSDIEAGDIDVDVDHTTKVITLTGFVPTDEQRTRAENVAQRRADDYRIDNRLEVRATP
jgi:hypothetical protein